MEAENDANIHQTNANNYKEFQDVLQVKPRMQWAGTVRVDNYEFPSKIL